MSTGKTPVANPQTTLLLEILQKISTLEKIDKKLEDLTRVIINVQEKVQKICEVADELQQETEEWEDPAEEDLFE